MPNRSPRLALTWPRKERFLLTPRDEAGKPLWVDRDHPAASEVRLSDFTGAVGEVTADNPHSDNLLFTGDSIDVLRILAESPEYRRQYRGKVKLVYIDPPFNTGQVFEHYDDWMEHSTWLSFMIDRLKLIEDLLAPGGSVWIHLDDGEVHRMRSLMDEVLGPGNFVAQIAWRSTDSSSNNANAFAKDHNVILVYGKRSGWLPKHLPDAEKQSHYKNPNNDPRGPWYDGRDVQNPKNRDNLKYEVVAPNGNVIQPPTNGWRWERATLEEKIASGEVFFNADQTALKRITYLYEQEGLPPSDMWFSNTATGSTRQAKNHLKKLFPGVPTPSLFDTPKPELLMKRIIELSTDRGDIVLDCFAGSATTAAVAHKLGRRWVAVELQSETVEVFAKPRLTKVVRGTDEGGISTLEGREAVSQLPDGVTVDEAQIFTRLLKKFGNNKALDAKTIKELEASARTRPTKTEQWNGGGGFRTVEVAPSMYEQTPFGVMLAEWATNGRFSRAVAGQLGFTWQPDASPFCGIRGRMRLAVFDGAVGKEEIRHVVAALGERERLTVVAKAVLPGAESLLSTLSKGSRIRKAPRDLLTAGAARARRRVEGPVD